MSCSRLSACTMFALVCSARQQAQHVCARVIGRVVLQFAEAIAVPHINFIAAAP